MHRIYFRSTPLLFLTLALVGCNAGTTESPTNASPTSESRVTQTPAADLSSLSVGMKAPDFTVQLLGGESITLSKYVAGAGGPTILLFDRAHW